MAIYVPPWLDIRPSDFTQAAEAGARIGAQLAANTERAQAASERAQASEAIASSRIGAAQQIASARLAQQAKEEELNRQMREWEQNQRIKLSEEQLGSQEERAKEALGQRTAFESGMLSLRNAANDIAQQRADIAAGKAGGASEKMSTMDSHLLNDALVRRRQVQTEIDKASSDISTGGPTRAMLNKLRAAEADINSITQKYATPTTAATATSQGSMEGQRVRSKSTGRTGVVKNGDVIWDEQPAPAPLPPPGVLYQGLPGDQPVSSGNMYMGANLPELTDQGAQ